MKYKLIVNDNLIDCDENQSILDTLISNEFSVEYSCKRGDCNLCVAEIINGEVKTTENREKNLNMPKSEKPKFLSNFFYSKLICHDIVCHC